MDPRHTVRVDKVDAHVQRCATALREASLATPAYHSVDINTLPLPALAEVRPSDSEEVLRRTAVAVARLGELPLAQLVAAGCRQMLATAEAQGACDVSKKGRHLRQQASIVGHLEQRGVLGPGYTYLELGAGRGGLAAAVRHAVPAAPILLVERGASKNKRDRFLRPAGVRHLPGRSSVPKARRVALSAAQRESVSSRFQACAAWLIEPGGCPMEDCPLAHEVSEQMLERPLAEELRALGFTSEQLGRVSGAYLSRKDLPRTAPACLDEAASFMRARVDIRHLDVTGLPVAGPIVAVGKHLCGCATDLSLTALRRGELAGLAVATCCHQLCTLADYPLAGRAFLCSRLEVEEQDLPAAFEVLRVSSSWAVDGGDSVERYALGRACKRLLDEGRAAAVRADFNLDATLLHYVDEDLTRENRLLLAGPAYSEKPLTAGTGC